MQTAAPLRKLQAAVGRINRAYGGGASPDLLQEQSREALQEFLEASWEDWEFHWRQELQHVREASDDQVDVHAVKRTAHDLIQQLQPLTEHPVQTDQQLHQARQKLQQATGKAAQLLYGLGMAGRSREAIELAGQVSEEMIRDTAFQVEFRRVAHMTEHDPNQIAPAALAAAITYQPGNQDLSIQEALDQFGLAAGSGDVSFRRLDKIGQILYAAVAETDELTQGLQEVRQYLQERTRSLVGTSAQEGGQPDEPNLLEKQPIEVPALLGMEARFRGTAAADTIQKIEELREEAGLRLFQNHMAMRQALLAERTVQDQPANHQGARRVAFSRMRNLEEMMDQGHTRWQQLERKWKEDVERQMSIQKVNVFPLQTSEDIDALEALEMYFQEAMKKGLPVGQALAQLYDSDLTLGPREARRLEEIIFRGGYQFTIDYAAEGNWSLLEQIVGDNRRRIEEAQSVLRDIEVGLRQQESASIEQLTQQARNQLREAIRQGLLPDGSGQHLTSVIDEMIDRIQAHQEIQHLLHLYAQVERDEFQKLLEDYTTLPYTQRFALGTAGEEFQDRTARNGQTMEELENSVRRTWKQERAGVRSGQDHLIEEEEEDQQWSGGWKSRQGGRNSRWSDDNRGRGR